MEPQLKILKEIIRQNLIRAEEQTTKSHDAKYVVRSLNFRVGDRVYLQEQPKLKNKAHT